MDSAALPHAPALTLPPARHGNPAGPPGLRIQEHVGREIIGIAARRGRADEVSARIQSRWGLTLPKVPRFIGDGAIAFAWSGADQWLAHAPPGTALEPELRTLLLGLASITVHGDGRVVLHVSGPAARTTLATGLPIDLHPRAFAPGHAALTLAGHIPIHIRQLDDAPTYELAAFRSFADDLCTWLLDAASPHGATLLPPDR